MSYITFMIQTKHKQDNLSPCRLIPKYCETEESRGLKYYAQAHQGKRAVLHVQYCLPSQAAQR